MKKITVASLALFLLVATGCTKEKLPTCPDCKFTCLTPGEAGVLTNDCLDNYSCSFELHKNAMLDYSGSNTGPYIESGNKLVFALSSATQGSPMVADDEITTVLYFEIDAAQQSFLAEGDLMDLLNLRFQQLCYCVDISRKKPTGGCMQGQRIDGSHWMVQGNLTFSYDFGTVPFKFEAVFSD
ncbi:MAG: hypothetical protein EPO28_13365 [Saprospiraceae bacterium]|nr:MAG: hypothetical protein EPO28_13365 [Saprospiraceae bacterium]